MAIFKKVRVLGAFVAFIVVAGIVFALAPEEKQPPAKRVDKSSSLDKLNNI